MSWRGWVLVVVVAVVVAGLVVDQLVVGQRLVVVLADGARRRWLGGR